VGKCRSGQMSLGKCRMGKCRVTVTYIAYVTHWDTTLCDSVTLCETVTPKCSTNAKICLTLHDGDDTLSPQMSSYTLLGPQMTAKVTCSGGTYLFNLTCISFRLP
jgi:hypothetical protein